MTGYLVGIAIVLYGADGFMEVVGGEGDPRVGLGPAVIAAASRARA